MIVLLAVLAVRSGLELNLEVPPVAHSGDEVVATIWAKNSGTSPIVCVIPSGPNASLGVIWKGSLRRGDELLVRDERGPFMGQWMHEREIGTLPFAVLKPGDRMEFYKERFKAIFPSGHKPGLISELAKAPRAPLSPGDYVLCFRYGFDRTFKPTKSTDERWQPFAVKLTKKAQALYDRTWTGAIDVSAKFTVVP